MRWLGGWRVALRLARREARRARGRSILILAMIIVPVAALAFAAAVYDTFTLSPTERADRLMGAAQAAIVWPFDGSVRQDPADLTTFTAPSAGSATAPPAGSATAPATAQAAPPVERLLALLPPGTRVIEDQHGRIVLWTAAGVGQLDVRLLDYTDPLARGILRPLSGRAPTSPDEVALTPAAADRLGARAGDAVRLADGSREFRVVGTVEDPTDLAAAALVLRPGALPPASLANGRVDVRWLAATAGPLTWADVKRLNTHGVVAVSRYVLAHPPGDAERYPEFAGGGGLALGVPGIGGGLAVLEIVLLAGPAFAVGARRRRRDLALVAAAGASPSQLRRIVLADGAVLGAAAATGGILLGVAAAAAARPWLEEHLYHARSGGFRAYPLALAVLAGLAVLTAVLAALVPAFLAARQDVVAALAGRRGITRSRRRWVVLGAALGAAGAGIAAAGAWRISATTILAGLAVAELGLILCTPAVVGLVARLGRFLPLGPRIALRDSSRNRTAAAPAISAVMAAVVGSLATGVVLNASAARTENDYRSAIRTGDVVLDRAGKFTPNGPEPVPASALAALRSTLPVDQVYPIGVPACGPGECFVTPRAPAAQDCPYTNENLRRDPTPDEQRAARRDPRCDGLGRQYFYFNRVFTDGFTAIVDASAVGALTGLPPADTDLAAAALRAGKVVVDHPRFLEHGTVTLSVVSFLPGDKRPATRNVTVAAVALAHQPRAPIVLMSEATARSIGVRPVESLALATTTRMPTVAEQDRLHAAVRAQVGVYVERGAQSGPHGSDPHTGSLILLAVVAGLITLGAAAIATGLAAADGRADLTTLAAVGAAPGVRRTLALSQSGVIAGLGSLLGAAAGLGAASAVLVALNQAFADLWPAPTPYPIAMPWLDVGVALVVVPVVAMAGTVLFTRARLPVERRR